MTHATKLGLGLATVLFGGALLTGCNDANDPGTEYAAQMYDSVPLEPLRQVEGAKNPFNPMGINERVPPQGAIPRGKLAYFTHINPDSVGTAARRLVNPYKATPATLADGKVLYERYCQHCHGETGDGQGPVGIKFKGVPNYSAGAYKNMNAGHIYHVIQYGKGRMMPHGSQVNPEERWKIALYVHTLQHKDEAAAAPEAGTSTGDGSATGAPTQAGAAPSEGGAPAVAPGGTATDAGKGAAGPPATVLGGTSTAPASAPAANAAAAPAAAPAAPADTRTPAQRATDKTRQTHVF